MPTYILNREQIRNYDKVAIEELGILGAVLMENAGRGAAQVIKRYVKRRDDYVVVVCGGGNNGGDGFVVARHLTNQGIKVIVIVIVDESKIKGDAKYNLEILKRSGVEIRFEREVSSEIEGLLKGSCVIVDAILGTGLNKEVRSPIKEWISLINKTGLDIVSIDIPSGIDSDSGKILGAAIKAKETVTFGALKTGLVLYPGAKYSGKIYLASIGVPDSIIEKTGFSAILIDEDLILSRVKFEREPDSHKGNFGHLLVIGGSPGKSGAAILCGEASIKVGTGLVTIASSREAQRVIETKTREAMSDSFIDSFESPFSQREKEKLLSLLDRKSTVVIGPGLGTSPTAREAVKFVLSNTKAPIVIDADGINIIAKEPEILNLYNGEGIVLTPHPGEMARLCKKTTKEVQSNRLSVALEQAKRFNVYVVLKGAHTIVATPDSKAYITISGNPGMATGGMGDILTGFIGGFLAQGLSLLDSSIIGVFLHALMGDILSLEVGMSALTPSDILNNLWRGLKAWEEGRKIGEINKIEYIY